MTLLLTIIEDKYKMDKKYCVLSGVTRIYDDKDIISFLVVNGHYTETNREHTFIKFVNWLEGKTTISFKRNQIYRMKVSCDKGVI